MVKYFLVFLSCFLALSCTKNGCTDEFATNFNSDATKDDGSCLYSPPIIELMGNDTVYLCLQEVYTDSGFFAQDIYGNDITTYVEVDNELNIDSAGFYEINYSVTDSNGNSFSTKRVIKVEICLENFLGNYQVADDCQVSLVFMDVSLINDSQSIAEGDADNEIFILNFNPFINQVNAVIENENIIIEESVFSIAQVPLNLDVIISGNGTISNNGNVITLNYNYDLGLLGVGNCQATYLKQ